MLPTPTKTVHTDPKFRPKTRSLFAAKQVLRLIRTANAPECIHFKSGRCSLVSLRRAIPAEACDGVFQMARGAEPRISGKATH
jgi:hypothetical protein